MWPHFIKSGYLWPQFTGLHEIHELFDVRVQVVPARAGAPAPRLHLRALELDRERVHEAIHEPAKGGDRRQLDDFGAVEIF